MVKWAPAIVLCAVACIEVDPLLPCRDARDCPRGEACAQGACVVSELDAAAPAPDVAPVVDMAAEETPCERACARIADCAVTDELCPALGPESRSIIIDGCVPTCGSNRTIAGLILSKRTCVEVIAAIRALNPAFDASCERE